MRYDDFSTFSAILFLVSGQVASYLCICRINMHVVAYQRNVRKTAVHVILIRVF